MFHLQPSLRIIIVPFLLMTSHLHGMENQDEPLTLHAMYEKAKPYLTVENPLFGVHVYHQERIGPPPGEIIVKHRRSSYDLKGVNWLYTSHVKEGLDFVSGMIVNTFLKETGVERKRYDFEDDISFYVLRQGQSIRIALMKPLYPSHLALKMLHEVDVSPKIPDYGDDLDAVLKKYNTDELRNDRIYHVTQEIEETKKVLLEDLEKLQSRGQTLEKLAQETASLNKGSEEFLKKARKMNRCCWLF